MENNNISQIERNHFIQKVDWIESEIIGSGLTLSVNKTVIPAQYKTKLNEFNPENSINELIRFGFEKQVNIELLRIASLYLSANVKSRAINTEHSMNILFDYIIEDCGNLELQEINFIFRNGIIGKFGVIFNDISIDTICGVGGWIETYYKDFRKLREEPTKVQNVKLHGKEITEAEFLERNPEFKERVRLRQLLELAKGGKITSDLAKEFYTIKGLDPDADFKADVTVYSHNYFARIKLKETLPKQISELDIKIENATIEEDYNVTSLMKQRTYIQRLLSEINLIEYAGELQYLNHHHCRFIIENVYKSKK